MRGFERIYTMKRFLTFILVFLMLVSCFAMTSCNKNDKNKPADTKGDEEYIQPDDLNEQLDIPESVMFDGEFKILGFNGLVPEFGDSTLSEPDMVEQTLLERDYFVEERLGVIFQYSSMNGQWGDRLTYSDTVRTSVLTGNKAWDLIGTYSMIPANLAINGITVDLAQLDYLNFEKAWYSQFMVDACTAQGKTYFISGDVSTNLLYSMQGVIFSAERAKDNGIEEADLYQMVYDGTWTVENWFTMCEDLGQELGGDGVWDRFDFYPIVVSGQSWLDSFYFSTGMKTVEVNENGVLQVSGDLLSEKVMEIYANVYDAVNTYHSFSVDAHPQALLEEKCIFSISQMAEFRSTLAQSEEMLRLLPFPKYEEGSNTTYMTTLSFGHTQYCIPKDIDDPDRSAAVLETLGYASYVYITPVIFEETMKLRYSENRDVSNMFDYLRRGCTFDIGSFYCIPFERWGSPHGMFRSAIVNGVTNWVSNYNNNFKTGTEHMVAELNKFYSK